MKNSIIPYFGFKTIRECGEVFFEFRKIPNIITSLPEEDYLVMGSEEVNNYLRDAVLCALQAIVKNRGDVPDGDDVNTVCDGFVELSVEEAMKIALYGVYKENFSSISELSRKLEIHETAARRLLNLRHRSRPDEIRSVMSKLGKRLQHEWRLMAA